MQATAMDNTKPIIPSPKKSRLYYIDNLKVFLIILVILHHVGQAYGPTGGYSPYVSSSGESASWLGSFFAVNAAFFMGLFFMISGYFLPGSYERKSGFANIKSKLMRYGIPILFTFLIMQPAIAFFHYNNYSGNPPLGFLTYYKSIYFGIGGEPTGFISSIGFPEMNFGHLWFVEHLLIYSLLYFVYRKIFQKKSVKKKDSSFRTVYIVIIAALIVATTGIIRIYYRIDYWFALLGFIQIELAHLPQYLTLFVTGIIAYEKNWFSKISNKQGYISLVLGLLMALTIYLRPVLPIAMLSFISSIWFIYESIMSVLLCLGLIVIFREKISGTNSFVQTLSNTSYLAYILHFPIVIFMQYSLDKVSILGASGKFIVVGIISISLTYLICYFLRKITFLRKIV